MHVLFILVLSSEQWPPWEEKACTSDNKQKAMYGSMKFDPTVKAAPFTKMRVRVKLDDFRQTPNLPATARGGGVYIAYTIPGGYLGVQANFKSEGGGQFFLSMCFYRVPNYTRHLYVVQNFPGDPVW